MDSLFDKWKTKVPNYSTEFSSLLFDPLSKKFGGSEEKIASLGKHFSTNYELYIYAFFLGLYNDEYIEIEKGIKKTNFSHHIQYWGNKGNRQNRKDFSSIQYYIFMTLINKSEIDLIELEKGNISEDDVITELMLIFESYTNGGLTLIKVKLEDNPNFYFDPTALLNFIVKSNSK